MAAFEDDASWKTADWNWDAHKLTAAPANTSPTLKGSGGKAARSAPATDTKQGCQVDGCSTEVGGMRDYHSRYKICEAHLKAPVVHKDGQPLRFCQQCGKFQPLGDFDGEKRSCRARLDKHNARRRRQREMAHMLKTTGTVDEKLLAEKYGLTEEELAPKLARMSKQGHTVKSPRARSGSAGPSSAAAQHKSPSPSSGSQQQQQQQQQQQAVEAGATATSAEAASGSEGAAPPPAPAAEQATAALLQQLQVQAQAQSEAQLAAGLSGPPLPASLGDLIANAPSDLPPPPMPMPVPAGASLGDTAMGALLLDDAFLDEVFNPMMAQVPGLGLPPPDSAAAAAASTSFLQMDAACAMELEDMASLEALTNQLIATGRLPGLPGGAPLHQQQHAPLVGNWPNLAMPLPSAGVLGGRAAMPTTPTTTEADMGAVPPYMAPQQPAFPAFGDAAAFPSGLQPPPPLPGVMRVDLLGSGLRVDSPGSVRSSATAMDLGGLPPVPGSVLDEALNLLSFDSAQVAYVPEEKLVRFSAKLFNCTPAQLPSDLKASLVNMLSCQSMEGYLRPGCVHLTVNALMGSEEHALLASSGVRAVVERLVARQPGAFWSEHAMLIQLGDKLVLVREGRVVHVLATGSSSLFPRLEALRPLAAAPDAAGCSEVAVWGYNLDKAEDTILARCKGAYVEVERLSLEADPAWRGMQKLSLRLSGLPASGVLQLEVMRGGYMSGSKATLLTRDRGLVAEVRSLEADKGATDVDTLLFQLAAAEEHCAVLGKSSRQLLAFAVQRIWVAATRTLLGAAVADVPCAEAMSEVDILCVGTTGMPLLKLAVRSQSLDLVQALLQWGDANSHVFKSTTPGRRGLTALHLAGLVRDGGAIAVLLSEKCADAVAGWEGAPAEDGTLPIDYARRTGTAAVLERFIATKHFQSIAAAVVSAAAAGGSPQPPAEPEPCPKTCLLHRPPTTDSAASSRNQSKLLGPQSPRHGGGEEKEDSVGAAKAVLKAGTLQGAQQGALLRFQDPQLESRFQAWYAAGQVPADIAFLVIAILSHGAWIFRWATAASGLSMALAALMALNAAVMQMAVLFPRTYIRWREQLCMLSHISHKAAHAAVTLVPPVGTIFSASYNPSVALLESSSLAQIYMLSFGLKLRFGTHLIAGCFHFLASLAANEAVCAAGFPFLSGGACKLLLMVWQALACFALPCALVYASEKRSRRIFTQVMAD
ncbi:Teosinte glume architecture 1 [Chlorella vulgaris]